MLNFGFSLGKGIGGGGPAIPDWWQIPSLDSSDILGVWDFATPLHSSREEALVKFEGVMPDFTIDAGDPSWTAEDGLRFNGSGAIMSRIPDGVDVRDFTAIIEFANMERLTVLDAFYSHYIDTRYTLQNGWDTDKIRWSCGDDTSGTIEEGNAMTEGVIATCGRALYIDGVYMNEVAESGEAVMNGIDFRVGCIWVDTGRTQFMKGNVSKLLLVRRVLTGTEVQEIYDNMRAITYNGEVITYDGETITC